MSFKEDKDIKRLEKTRKKIRVLRKLNRDCSLYRKKLKCPKNEDETYSYKNYKNRVAKK